MFRCEECGKELNTKQGLNGHLRLKHNKQLLTRAGVLSAPVARLEKGKASTMALLSDLPAMLASMADSLQRIAKAQANFVDLMAKVGGLPPGVLKAIQEQQK